MTSGKATFSPLSFFFSKQGDLPGASPLFREGPLGDALGACRRHFVHVAIFSAALNVLYLAPSLYMLQVYDRVLASRGVLTLVFLSIVLIAALGVLAFLDATRTRLLAVAARRLDRIISPLLLQASLTKEGRAAAGAAQPLREFDAFKGALTGPPAIAFIDAPWAPLYIAACFIMHFWLGVLVTLGGIFLVALAFANERALRRAMKVQEDAGLDLYALQQSDSAQAETVRAMGMRGAVVGRQMQRRDTIATAQLATGNVGSKFSATTKFARLGLQSAALGLGAYLAIEQQISAGAMIAASILTSRAFAPLEAIVGAWRQIGMGMRGCLTVEAVLNATEATRKHTALPAPRGALSLEQVGVKAPGGEHFMLQGVSLELEAGEVVGVFGPSGAGKSTLARVLSGAAEPDEGSIRIDGARYADWNADELGAHIGYVAQEIGLLQGTVAANISRMSDAPVDAGIVAAAQAAGVHDLILKLPLGYDTPLGANGRGLSAGQAQRIALARALYGDPRLLVLDEPNAHMDADGEAALLGAIKAAKERGATVIVMAHRGTFMSIVDKVLTLRNGGVESFGPRDQFLARFASGPAVVAGQGGRK